jgi:hypothetical protein
MKQLEAMGRSEDKFNFVKPAVGPAAPTTKAARGNQVYIRQKKNEAAGWAMP